MTSQLSVEQFDAARPRDEEAVASSSSGFSSSDDDDMDLVVAETPCDTELREVELAKGKIEKGQVFYLSMDQKNADIQALARTIVKLATQYPQEMIGYIARTRVRLVTSTATVKAQRRAYRAEYHSRPEVIARRAARVRSFMSMYGHGVCFRFRGIAWMDTCHLRYPSLSLLDQGHFFLPMYLEMLLLLLMAFDTFVMAFLLALICCPGRRPRGQGQAPGSSEQPRVQGEEAGEPRHSQRLVGGDQGSRWTRLGRAQDAARGAAAAPPPPRQGGQEDEEEQEVPGS